MEKKKGFEILIILDQGNLYKWFMDGLFIQNLHQVLVSENAYKRKLQNFFNLILSMSRIFFETKL